MNNDTPKDVWNFPCEFPIKIVGLANEEFETSVLATIHKHFPNLAESAIAKNPSKDGKYLAITAVVNAESKVQLDEAYKELTGNKLVLFAL